MFHLGSHTILEERFLSGNLLQRGLAASLLQLPKAVEAIAAIAHQSTGFGHIVELLGQLEDTHLVLMIFWSVVMVLSFREGEDST